MLTDSELCLLRSIKKTAVVMLLMMRLDPRPTGESEIARLLGINKETARTYLRSLAACSLIARAYRNNGYILTAGGRQLLLPDAENPRITSTTTSTTYIEGEFEVGEAEIEESILSAEIPPSSTENPPSQSVIHTLIAAVIGEPKRSALAAHPEITSEIIQAWETHLKKTKGAHYTIGLLIHILESGDQPPGYEPGRYPSDYKESREDRKRYIEGPYAKYINH